VPKRIQKAVETKIGKSGVAKTKGRSRKEMKRKGTEERKEKTKERKKDESKESSRRMGNLG